ncbi:hypothetical protein [Hydrogenophaga pseudoflava]|uniref:hypothetical protein n=1 Tax=Hydrogenophaga pseudoflava TaxID=47421 RepID=UPI0027E3F2C0|nr:hypothetical protein [Hydrogenophaga pseudoflava]MDQ7743883.1 hypothetical protein [Hydrogenophaga pseudoflava]
MSPIHPTTPAPRSTFVTTLAWLMIVPSALGVLMSTLQSILVFTMLPMDQMVLPPADQMAQMPAFAVFMLEHMRAVMVAFWLLTVLALASGIGLLKRREWARLVVIALLALSIVMNLGGLYVQQSFLSAIPATADAPPEFREQFESMASTMWTASLAMALVFSGVSAWLIWRLASAPVKAEFAAAA